MPSARRVLLLTLALLALLLTSSAAPAQDSIALGKLRRVMMLAQTQALKRVPVSVLVNGALEGVRRELARQGQAADYLEGVPEGTEQWQAMELLESALARAARENPALAGELPERAVVGALARLGDPYAAYLDPGAYRRLKETMEGEQFGGIGVFVASHATPQGDDALLVLELASDSPAERAGLQGGDLVVSLDGVGVARLGARQARDLLRGQSGTPVRLGILRPGGMPFEVTLVREETRMPSVTSRLIEQGGRPVGYVKIWVFGSGTAGEVSSAVKDLQSRGAGALILDLRNNGGGYVSAAVAISSEFLPKGSRIVSVEERNAAPRVYSSHGAGSTRLPLVVLQNEWSASASEITAGALRDNGVATLVGVRSYGKGSVQKIVPMEDRSAVKLTTAHYRTPSGRDINGLGIDPDVVVATELKDLGTARDAQFAEALRRARAGVGSTVAR